MMPTPRRFPALLCLLLAQVLLRGLLPAQQAASPTPAAEAQKALALAEQGRCQQALPVFLRVLPKLTDKTLIYRSAMGQARCAMAREDSATALSALILLRKQFPDDPAVLFVSVHYFSQLAMRTSRELAAKAPESVEARRLEAEAYESAAKWDEAIGTYRGILRTHPKTPGIHYRIGQALLSKAGEAAPPEEARLEFQHELELNPLDAASDFVLGELDRRAGRFDEAAAHFRRAAQSDGEFAEAYIALGISLLAASKFQDAVAPLETYTKMVPGDPLGHYQLALAYGRTGNREGAEREMAARNATAAQRQLERGSGRTLERTVR